MLYNYEGQNVTLVYITEENLKESELNSWYQGQTLNFRCVYEKELVQRSARSRAWEYIGATAA